MHDDTLGGFVDHNLNQDLCGQCKKKETRERKVKRLTKDASHQEQSLPVSASLQTSQQREEHKEEIDQQDHQPSQQFHSCGHNHRVTKAEKVKKSAKAATSRKKGELALPQIWFQRSSPQECSDPTGPR
jgi:hypothetical protein